MAGVCFYRCYYSVLKNHLLFCMIKSKRPAQWDSHCEVAPTINMITNDLSDCKSLPIHSDYLVSLYRVKSIYPRGTKILKAIFQCQFSFEKLSMKIFKA